MTDGDFVRHTHHSSAIVLALSASSGDCIANRPSPMGSASSAVPGTRYAMDRMNRSRAQQLSRRGVCLKSVRYRLWYRLVSASGPVIGGDRVSGVAVVRG